MKRVARLALVLLFHCSEPAKSAPPRVVPPPSPAAVADTLSPVVASSAPPATTPTPPTPPPPPVQHPCSETEACRTEGKCRGVVEAECYAGTDEDCAKSEACAKRRACRVVETTCAADCRERPACRDSGRCKLEHGACVHSGTEDCRKSRDCREAGACTFSAAAGGCVPGSVADCARMQRCSGGKCIFFASACHVKTPCVCNLASGTACDEFGDSSGEGPRCGDTSKLVEQCVAAGGPRPTACPPPK